MKIIRPVRFTALAVAVSILFTGCATVHKPLKPDLMEKKHNLTVYSFIPHEKITVGYIGSGLMVTGPGLIGALVGAAVSTAVNSGTMSRRERKINAKLIPLQKAVAHHDFRPEFWHRLDPVISDAKWFNAVSVKKLPALASTEKNNLKLPVLILETFYELSVTFQVLTVQTKSSLYINSLETPDFAAIYTYYSNKIGSKRTSHRKWAANGGTLLQQELRAGIDENMKMIRYELLNDPANKAANQGKSIEIKMRDPKTWKRLYLSGKVIEESASRILLRASTGNLFSVSTGLRE